MKIAAIICEYNPLHTGHVSHIKKTLESADCVFCIMSGSFVQRGEPAMYDKFIRTRWALQAGVSAVFELSTVYSLQSAEGFAQGAVLLASRLGADLLSFGSECADIDTLKSVAQIYADEPADYKAKLKEYLSKGKSHPDARASALMDILDIPAECLLPNSTLAVEYIKAIMKHNLELQPYAVKRVRPGVSASKCREIILNSGVPPVPDYVAWGISKLPCCTLESLEQALLYALRTMPQEAFAALPDISEGLNNRLINSVRTSTDLSELLKKVSTKRYTLARIKRILCCALLGITSKITGSANQQGPTYARLLGIRKDCEKDLSAVSQKARIPVITKPAQLKNDLIFSIDQKAADVRAIAVKEKCDTDFTTKFIVV